MDEKEKKQRKKGKWGKRIGIGFLGLLVVGVIAYVITFVPLVPHNLNHGEHTVLVDGKFSYTLPLDNTSPWPKFRADAMQTGRTPVIPKENTGLQPWSIQTGKGIFSTPVVGADGTVYIGSADHIFYAIAVDGTILWTLEIEGIIDSSALLHENGYLYFGAGDGKVYCIDRETGEVLWTFEGQTPQEVEEEYNIKTYNLGWFEGNIAVLPDGSLLAPNDNYLVYRLSADTGEKISAFLANEMVWTSPAVNVETGRLFFGTCAQVLENVYAYDYNTGQKKWLRGGLGTVSSSPLLLNNEKNGVIIVGSFDGYVRAMSQIDGKTIWQTPLGDHIYASAAMLSDGTIIQPAANGTVYALNPKNGKIIWSFDTLEPIRSSPAVDGEDNIYFGSGEGKLFCLNSDGSLKWSYQLILSERNDLNASPALGFDGIYIAGESGEIFFMPYDYPLSAEGLADGRTHTGGETMQDEGIFLYALHHFGTLTVNSETTIDANQSIAYQLFVRKNGDTLPSQIDKGSVKVEIYPEVDYEVKIAANGRFLYILPKEYWPDTEFQVKVTVTAKTGFWRLGLKEFFGSKYGTVTKEETFYVKTGEPEMAIHLPESGAATVFELKRISVPNPVMLPSYNQIGFDSLHYLAGAVYEVDGKIVFWVVGGKNESGETVYDPSIKARYPLVLEQKGSLLTFYNYDGFKINFIGSWDMPFKNYRIAANSTDLLEQEIKAQLSASMNCDEIEYYGLGLKLMGMSDFNTGVMNAYGAVNIKMYESAVPLELSLEFHREVDKVVVTLDPMINPYKTDEHIYSILVTDIEGNPLPLYYTRDTLVEEENGWVSSVSISWDKKSAPTGDIIIYFIIDNAVAGTQLLPLK